MTAAALELQKAIFGLLSNDAALGALLGGGKVYDHAPADVAFPYITFGRTSLFDWSTDTDTGSEQLFSIHVWSKRSGKRETLRIMEAARAALDGAGQALEGYRLVLLRLEDADARYDEAQAVHHGTLRLRALIEPAD
ncbi:MAG: DUF3168 domain-containing protein [Rhizobiaceae bacterium]|nr:DUF3168 domain-containing protein [Rhizobiaceae bacterium]